MKKRLICFLMIGAVVLGLCSCQNQQKEEVAQVDLLEENFEQTAEVPQQSASLPVLMKRTTRRQWSISKCSIRYRKMRISTQL